MRIPTSLKFLSILSTNEGCHYLAPKLRLSPFFGSLSSSVQGDAILVDTAWKVGARATRYWPLASKQGLCMEDDGGPTYCRVSNTATDVIIGRTTTLE
jgi:hypothetical protein